MEIAGAQSVYRVLDVLTEVSLKPGQTAGEVAEALGLTAPTTHRLLRVLCDRGFAIQNESGKYVAGPQMRVLAGDRVDHAALEEIGRPLLAQLRNQSTETVFLAVREGLQLEYRMVLTSSHSVQMYGEVGQQIPLHATSQGKVILAFLPPGVGERIIDQLELARYTPSTITSAVELHEAMYDIRRDGYAVNLEEREFGVRSVAAPVLDASGNVVASVCVGGPIFRVSEADLRGKFADLVCATAESISAELLRKYKPIESTDERSAQ